MQIQRVASILVLCTVMAAGAQASGGSNGHGGGVDKLAKKLDLSSEQVEQLKVLKSKKRSAKKLAVENRQSMKGKGVALLDNYSSEAANSLANEAAEIARNTTLARLEHMQNIYNILNDNQKQKFKAMLEKDHSGNHKRKRS